MDEKTKRASWAWSMHGHPECYRACSPEAETREQALAEALDESGAVVGDTLWLSPIVYPDVSRYVPTADTIVDLIRESAADEACDGSDFPDVSNDARADLDSVLEWAICAWAKRHGIAPDFFEICSDDNFEVTDDMLEGE